MINLRYDTPQAWTDTVLADLDSFLVDHAACERKASATGMNFVVRYSDRTQMIGPMIAFAREEMAHFHQVWTWMNKRGLKLGNDTKDQYVRALMKHVRNGRDERLMDRLIMAAVVEARGFERFGLVADALPEGPLKSFYEGITLSEGRHRGFFLDMARLYFDEADIVERLGAFLDFEAQAIAAQPLRATVH